MNKAWPNCRSGSACVDGTECTMPPMRRCSVSGMEAENACYFTRMYERRAWWITGNWGEFLNFLKVDRPRVRGDLVGPFAGIEQQEGFLREWVPDFFDHVQRNVLDQQHVRSLLDRAPRPYPMDAPLKGHLFIYPPTKNTVGLRWAWGGWDDDEGACLFVENDLRGRGVEYFKNGSGYCQVQITTHCQRRPRRGHPHREATKGSQDLQSYLHRIVCFLISGPPHTQERRFAIHSCGHKSCVSPHHVHWGTQEENLTMGYGPAGEKIGYVCPPEVLDRRKRMLQQNG